MNNNIIIRLINGTQKSRLHFILRKVLVGFIDGSTPGVNILWIQSGGNYLRIFLGLKISHYFQEFFSVGKLNLSSYFIRVP